MKIILIIIIFRSNSFVLFCLLGLSESNQNFEKQILKGKLNKGVKSLQKNFKKVKKWL